MNWYLRFIFSNSDLHGISTSRRASRANTTRDRFCSLRVGSFLRLEKDLVYSSGVCLQDESRCHGDSCPRNLNCSHCCFNSMWLCGQLGGRGQWVWSNARSGPSCSLSTGFTNQASLGILLEVAWTQFKTPFTLVCLYLDSPFSRSNSLEPFSWGKLWTLQWNDLFAFQARCII